MLPPIGVPGCIDMENPSFAHNLLSAPWQRGFFVLAQVSLGARRQLGDELGQEWDAYVRMIKRSGLLLNEDEDCLFWSWNIQCGRFVDVGAIRWGCSLVDQMALELAMSL